MASIHRDIPITASADTVWDAVRDVCSPHTRIVPGVLTDARADGPDHRVVTFADGFVACELIVDVDEAHRRVAYAVVDGPFTHHHASMQVVADGAGSRLVWTTDLLPDDVAPMVEGLMDLGAGAMQRTLGG